MSSTILITGGAGYVGSALVPYLLERGYRVIVYDLYLYGRVFSDINNDNLVEVVGDVRDREKLINAARGVDQIIHLACISNDPSFDLDPALGRSINYDAFFNVVAAMERNKVKRLINASSSSIYGVKDGEVTEAASADPITDYAKYKWECERVLRQSKLNYVTVRPATICGYARRLRQDLTVNILTINALVNRVVKVFGGSQLRPNLNIGDVVRVYEELLRAPDSQVSGEVFNVGYQNLPVREIADIVRYTPRDPAIMMEELPTNDIRSYQIESQKIKRVLGLDFNYTIEDAVWSLREAYERGLIIDGLNNPIYHNIKMMKLANVK